MLNPYFAFGVPLALIILYILFSLVKKVQFADYRRFTLALIAVFMTTFNFQVYRYSQTVLTATTQEKFTDNFGYNPNFLLIPVVLGLVLAIYNLILVFRQFSKKE